MSSCPIPLTGRDKRRPIEASFPLFHVKLCMENLIFENFIHYLHKKLFWNKERSNSTRIWPCSQYFFSTGSAVVSPLRIQGVVRRWQRHAV
jgi:hypothetical protein